MRKLLEAIDKNDLIDFILDYANKNSGFQNSINVHFTKPDFDKELEKIRFKIEDTLDFESGYHYRDSWGNVDFCTGDIIEEVYTRMQQGNIKLAFAEIELLYRKLLVSFEYQGECEISDAAGNCLDVMMEIADNAKLTSDKEYIFNQCLKLSQLDDGKNYGADYEDKLLSIAVKFVSLDNYAKIDIILKQFETCDHRAEEFKLIRLEIIRKIYDDNVVDDFIAENIQFQKIREIAYEREISQGNYTFCEQLCIDALSLYEQRYGISPWLYRLFSIYEMTDDIKGLKKTGREILICGDFNYYAIYKALYNKDEWKNLFVTLLDKLEEDNKSGIYTQILIEENLNSKLLDYCKKYPSSITSYYPHLIPEYQYDVGLLFMSYIKSRAELANKRSSYKYVCDIILLYEKACGIEAYGIRNELMLSYSNKPAFVDELRKLKLKKV